MAGTPVLLVSLLLLSPYVLLSANSRHVPNNEGLMPIRVVRTLREKYKDLLSSSDFLPDDSTNIETTIINDCKGVEEQMKRAKAEMEKYKSRSKDLEKANFDLNKKLRDEITTNRKTGHEAALQIAEMQLKLTGLADKMGSKSVRISKFTLQFLSKYIEYRNQEANIEKAKDSDLVKEKKKLEKMGKELSLAEQELIAAGRSSDLDLEEEKNNLQESLDNKEKQNQRLKEKVETLEKSNAEIKNSCTSLKQRYTDLKTKFEEDMNQIEDVPKLIIKINMLNSEIETLKNGIDRESGDKTELLKKLKAKKKELEEAETDLKERSPSSKGIKELITVIRERVTEDSENIQDYLKRISDLEDELDENIAKLGEKEAANIQAMMKVLAYQDEITQLKDKLAKVKMATSQKIAEKEAELEKTTQEIIKMKADDCGTGKKKEEIATLERKARELDAEVKRLKKSSQKDIADLEKRLKEKEEDLQASTEKLQSVDKEKGALIAKTIKMQGEMDALINGEKDLKQSTADEIADLKSRVQEKEQELAKLKVENKDLTSNAEEAKACTALKKRNGELQEALSKKDEDQNKLLKERDEALSSQKEAEDDLKKLKKTSAALAEEKNNLQESLDRKEKQNQSLKEKVENLEKKNKEEEEKAIIVARPAIDPDTAHPKLQLSNGNSVMRLLDTPLNVPDRPTRYNSIFGALASTGFDHGRQYWEIGVAEKHCYVLGVAAGTASRIGNIQFSPKNQYWTLMLSRSDILRAHAIKKTTLIEAGKAKPKMIGVLIDFKKSEISFYDSGARSHLYTFTNVEVKSKLFPFLSTCEDTDQGSPPLVFKTGVSADWLKS